MLTIEEVVLRAAKIKAARTGKRESQVIEEAVPRDLGLDLLERVAAEPALAFHRRPLGGGPQPAGVDERALVTRRGRPS